MVGLDDLRCQNADYSQVPGGIAQHDGCRRTTVVLLGDALVHGLFHGLLQGPALLIHRIEELRQSCRLVRLAGRSQLYAVRCRTKPTTGIEPWSELKPDFAH